MQTPRIDQVLVRQRRHSLRELGMGVLLALSVVLALL